MMPGLKRFQFFDKEELKSEDTGFRDFTPTCSASGRGSLILGDGVGVIRIYDRDYKCKRFHAHDFGVTALFQLKRSSILVSLGADADTVSAASIKFWRTDKVDVDGTPLLLRKLKIFNEKFPEVPVTCMGLLEDLSELAVGLGNGAVFLFSGDLLRDRSLRQLLLKREGTCITGVHFREDAVRPSLWVVSTEQILTFFIKDKTIPKPVVLDDAIGGEMRCSVVNDERQLVVVHKEDMKFFESDDIGPCSALDGTKKLVLYYKNYYVVVTEETKDILSERNTVTVYDWRDRRNKFVAFQMQCPTVVEIVPEWGRLLVLCATGTASAAPATAAAGQTPPATTQQRTAIVLTEQDLPTKMKILFSKNLYPIAISLARSQGSDEAAVMEIYQMHGDHLYKKGDFNEAITQYIETIQYVEPSYVIRKFLDAQRIHNLTRYLQALHSRQCATPDHTTLLLNCYTKLKDVEKLNEFIKSENGLRFDVATAINVCRQAGYHQHALYLAHRHKHHHQYLKIVLDDLQAYADGLDYIASLEFDDADRYVRDYGLRLMSASPEACTRLLQSLATDFQPVAAPTPKFALFQSDNAEVAAEPSAHSASGQKAKAEEYIHLFVDRPGELIAFLEYIVQREPNQSSVVYNTMLELYLREAGDDKNAAPANADAAKQLMTHPRQEKILALLKAPQSRYDVDHALVLCKTYRFQRGMLFLYEKLNLYHEILQHHMERGENAKIIEACKTYSATMPQLWLQALSYFAEQTAVSSERDLQYVLERVDEPNPAAGHVTPLLPPLMVIQILSQNKKIALRAAKDYIVRNLERQHTDIINDRGVIRRLQDETQRMREETEELRTHPKTFNAQKCHLCTSAIEFPAVHYLCGHSFHQRCLNDSDKHCPKCYVDYKRVLDVKESMRLGVGQHEKFFKQLDSSTDGFGTVAEYFGRGMFVRTAAPTEPSASAVAKSNLR